MSAEIHEFYQDPSNQPSIEPTIAVLYRQHIDTPNAEREKRQLSDIKTYDLDLAGKEFHVTTFQPTDGLRTWVDESGESIQYPEILMVHGVASDSQYFWEMFRKLNKLGIACAAVELPREHNIIYDGDALLEWQSDAMVTAWNFLQKQHDNKHIVLGGHSRGAIVAAHAATKIVDTDGGIEGLLLLAPSVEPKSLERIAINLFGLAYNSLRHSDDVRLVGRYALMIAKVVLENPQQTVVEIKQALTSNINDLLFEKLSGISIFIPAAENDEFVDHNALARLAQMAPAGNISVATLNTNHMLGEKPQQDIISLGDPRLLTGQILAWLQSQTKTYHPLSVQGVTGEMRRI